MTTRKDIERKLLANHLHGLLPEELIAPDYGGYSIDSIPHFIRALFGDEIGRGTGLSPLLLPR